MQLQMETCDLDECDFLETKFTEYDNEESLLKDGDFLQTESGDMKGIIMYFNTHDNRPYYIYKPLQMNLEEFLLWESKNISEYSENQTTGMTWIKNLYWKLNEISCVLVLRNKKWFNDNINQLQNIWNIIEKERITGYQHRAPNKRIKPEQKETKGICYITISKQSQNEIQSQNKIQSQNEIQL
jgi:hypothetical protein